VGGADALLDQRLIGSFPSVEQAQAELDRVAYEHALHEQLADPLTPCGALGGPSPHVDVSDADLDAAHADFCAFFATNPKVLERADRALDIAKHRERLTIREDGSVTIHGTKRYQVNDQGCTCRDFFARQGTHAGMCKHTIARELHRLAQAKLASSAQPTTDQDQEYTNSLDHEHTTEQEQDQTAFVDVQARALTQALLNISAAFEFGNCSAMQVSLVGNVLVLEADGQQERVEGSDGSGDADGRHTLQLARDEFLTLWDAYRPQARSLSSVQVFLSLSDRTLFLCSDTFAAEAHGSPSLSEEARP
jgi:hypothetical protein